MHGVGSSRGEACRTNINFRDGDKRQARANLASAGGVVCRFYSVIERGLQLKPVLTYFSLSFMPLEQLLLQFFEAFQSFAICLEESLMISVRDPFDEFVFFPSRSYKILERLPLVSFHSPPGFVCPS